MKAQALGKHGEQIAAAALEKKGYRIVRRNYHCRYGEIDLIAEQGEMVVFVEVKLRKNDRFSLAREAVGPAKRQKLRSTAACWLAEQEDNRPARFDVIEVYTQDGRIVHLEDAFQ
ncbi:MAG: YraN family protein [Clostridia bacterium]|nr:YraN family protein [Clostridia bacterium]